MGRASLRLSTQSATLACTAAVLISSVVLGGGTRPGFIGDVLLQLLAIPALLLAISGLFPVPVDSRAVTGQSLPQSLSRDTLSASNHRRILWAAAACGLVCLWPLLQLVPLPPALWTRLPDREHVARSFELLGQPLPWWPVSMVPHATWTGWLSLLPPAAVFLGTILLGYRARQSLASGLMAIGLASVLLGLLQVAQGPSSPLRFFEVTNPGDAVGFFANRNHYAALLYCLTLLAGVWAIEATISTSDRNRWMTSSLVFVVAAFAAIVVLIGAQGMARSRAGVGLSILALAGVFTFAMADRRTASTQLTMRLMTAAVAFAFIFTMQFALYRVMDRFGADPLSDWRLIFSRRTFAIAKEHWLFGSGIGTFLPVYQLHEQSRDLLANTYVNHAHNDIVQLILEAGAPGIFFLVAAGIWLAWRMIALWRQPAAGVTDLDQALARSATIMLLLIAIHSFVEYPLRTGAMLAVAAFAMALLVPPLIDAELPVEPATVTRLRPSQRQRTVQTAAPSSLEDPARDGAYVPGQAPAAFHWPAAPDAMTHPPVAHPPVAHPPVTHPPVAHPPVAETSMDRAHMDQALEPPRSPAPPGEKPRGPGVHWPTAWAQPAAPVAPHSPESADAAPPASDPVNLAWPPKKPRDFEPPA